MKINFIQPINNRPAFIAVSRTGKITSNVFTSEIINASEQNNIIYNDLCSFYKSYFKNTKYWKNISNQYRIEAIKDYERRMLNKLNNMGENYNMIINPYVVFIDEDTTETTTPNVKEATPEVPKIDFKAVLNNLINFFSEFEFEPNFRFINTMCLTPNKVDYIKNYFSLTDNAFLNSIVEKMKSAEFKAILEDLKSITPSNVINKHLEIYYGSQGTGKTTEAMKLADNNCMVCHSAMLPQDMLEDFDFDNGNATFKPSALYKAIEEGKTIVLDEINLLPWESVRFLQSILDGKKSFIYKGKEVKIHDDFKVIGTMNLTVNGSTYSLPEPLVDRAAVLKKFVLSAENLVSALI